MSFSITTSFVDQFSSNLVLLSQQKGSRLRKACRVENITGEEAFFDQIGSVDAVAITDRHGDSPLINTPHSRRRITPVDYEWGDLIDKLDKVKTLIDPASGYVRSGSYALGRSIDDEIISAATGTAYTGKAGGTSTVLPAGQKVAVTIGGGGGNAGLNLEKLIAAKSLFGKNDVDLDDPENKLYFAVRQQQLDDLLAETEIKSSDFNAVKALVKGEVDSFMGFEFIRTERLANASATDITTCFAWSKSGICVGLNQDIMARVQERADKRFSWYAYACMSVGASRMEEEKVVQISCDESP